MPRSAVATTFAEMKAPAHLALQPFGQIPTYQDGDLVLFESAAQPYMDPSSHSANPMDRVFRLADY